MEEDIKLLREERAGLSLTRTIRLADFQGQVVWKLTIVM